MRNIIAVAVALALVAMATPVQAAEYDNKDYFMDLAGWDSLPTGDAVIKTATGEITVTAAEALDLLAERAGGVDLASAVAGMGPGGAFAGDIWVLGFGSGGCGTANAVANPVPFTPVHGQLWIYAGAAGEMTDSSTGSIIAWTMKSGGAYSGSVTITGQSDFYCADFGFAHFFFPFLDGVAQ